MSGKVERAEKKYLLSELQTANLRSKLYDVLQQDPYNGQDVRGYTVRSLYFDTLEDTDFYDKVNGLERRRKIRLRCYPPDFDHLKLELKEKHGEFQQKRSVSLSRSEAMSLASGDYGFLQDKGELAVQIYMLMTFELYIPRCIVEYRRLAFVSEVNDTRITFDSELRVSEDTGSFFGPGFELYPVTSGDTVILEIKYRAFLFRYIKELLSDYSKIQTSRSKYYLARGFGHFITT